MSQSDVKSMYNTMFSNYPDVLSVMQLREALGISKHLAYDLINDGYVKALKIGNSFRIPKASLINYIYSNTEEPEKKLKTHNCTD